MRKLIQLLGLISVLLCLSSANAFAAFAYFTPLLVGGNNLGTVYRDANGWTVFVPITGTGSCSAGTYTGTCITYVSSSSGNDSTCAPVVATAVSFTPCQTPAKGLSLVRNAKPDWLLLKRGDTFTPNGSGNLFGLMTVSGVSAQQPIVIGSYDPSQPGVVDPYVNSARPLLENGMGSGQSAPLTTSGGTGGDFIAVVGLEFYNYIADPSNPSYNAGAWDEQYAIIGGNNISSWLLEDNKFSFYWEALDIFPQNNSTNPNATSSTLTMNRNVLLDSYDADSTTPQGMFTNYIANYSFTGNMFDHNGWNASVGTSVPSEFKHNIYMGCFTPAFFNYYSIVSITDSFWTTDASNAQFRMAGAYNGNLFAYGPGGMSLGLTSDSDCPPNQQDIYITAQNNVVIDSNSNVGDPGGSGISTTLVVAPATIENNIVSTFASTNIVGTPSAITAGQPTASSNNMMINNTLLSWTDKEFDAQSGSTGNVVSPNNFNCTTCYSGGTYPDPYRSLGGYYAANLSSVGEPVTFTNSSANIGWPRSACNSDTGIPVGSILTFSTTGSLPTNFSTNTPYYSISGCVNGAIQVSATPGGSAVTAGSAGTGTQTATVASAIVTGTINNCSPSCAGSTTSGNVMNVTAVTSGALNVGDAIIYPSQSISVTITGNANIGPNSCGASTCTGTGGTGTYAVDIALNGCGTNVWSACGTAAAIPLLVTSQTLTDYSGESLITAARNQSKANWNAVLKPCPINDWLALGFGLTWPSCPANS